MARYSRKSPSPLAYQERCYRTQARSGLCETFVRMMETDLHILAPDRVDEHALSLVTRVRAQIEAYISSRPEFLDSLVPLAADPQAPAPVQAMLEAAAAAGVGPMAAVAGMVAEAVGRGLERAGQEEVIVENGGDLYVHRRTACTVAVYAGPSPLSGRVGIRLRPEQMPCGVCTSSASIGHSLSLGGADAAVVVAPSTPFADALATRLGNEVGRNGEGMKQALELVADLDGVTGVVLIAGEKMGAWGQVELVRIESHPEGEEKTTDG